MIACWPNGLTGLLARQLNGQLAAGCGLLVAGCWLLAAAASCWLLAAVRAAWLQAAGCWPLAAGCRLLADGCCLLVAGCLLVAAGSSSKVAIREYHNELDLAVTHKLFNFVRVVS